MNRSSKWLVTTLGCLVVVVAVLVFWWARPKEPPPAEVLVGAENANANLAPVNLTNHYTSDLDIPWNQTSYPGDDLAELPRGLQEFDGVRFDIQGLIQLSGRVWKKRGCRFPEKVVGIPIQRACHHLYLLHADGGANAPTGTTVATLVLHYGDGTTAEIPIQHNIHVKDWWNYGSPPPSDPNTVVAWTGQNQATARMGKSLRLFKTLFENPSPQKRVETVDYVSAMEDPGPFLVAVTVQ